MRQIIFALALVAGLAPLAWADSASAIRNLAEHGDTKTQYAVGTMYRDGQGVAQDSAEALRWWRESAELGLIHAQFALGNIHAGGSRIARNYIRAYIGYRIARLQAGDEMLRGIAGSDRDALAARMTAADIFKARQLVVAWRAKHAS